MRFATITKSSVLKRLTSCRWELAFIKESPEEIVNGKKPHYLYINNPFTDYWFADPFILDVTNNKALVLAETMPRKSEGKASISLLTIDLQKKSITKMEIILTEKWHLSFPMILRKDGFIYVCPESAEAEKLFIYKLIQNKDGSHKLTMLKPICNDVVWDSDITCLFGSPKMFTAHRDNYHLDIYSWDYDQEVFIYEQSISSNRQNMRMAGSLFKVGTTIYCPQQDSGYTYGNAVEINAIEVSENSYKLSPAVVIRPPRRLMIDGLHTFNCYKGYIVVDILRQEHLTGLILRKLVGLKKRFSAK